MNREEIELPFQATAALASPRISGSLITSRTQQRSISMFDMFKWRKGRDTGPKPTLPRTPLTEEYLRRKPAVAPATPVPGGLDSSSIFEDEEVAGPQARSDKASQPILRNRHSMAAALDPDPRARKRWERKMVIRDITKRGRLTKTQRLKKEERDGKRVKVTNPTTLYVDQAWVGRGKFTKTPDYRARGQVSMMVNPTTGLTVVLKEEKTRIRLDQERKAKEAKRKVWVQLPDRPITAQRQYYSW
ncbi:hypothetical protein BUE80_DR013922 [Diplocarpon rosae]|nr:hypothetical protein BUE80_DR013922 [Diplocarpon rosae]